MKKGQSNKKMSVDGLAVLVAKGFSDLEGRMNKKFEQVDRRFESVDKRFESVGKRFDDLEGRLTQKIDGLSGRIDDLLLSRATQEQFTILEKRVSRLEIKTGVRRT